MTVEVLPGVGCQAGFEGELAAKGDAQVGVCGCAVDQRVAEGGQPGCGGCSWSQRGWARGVGRPKLGLGFAQQDEEQAAAVVEPSEERGLPDPGFLCDRLHGHVLGSMLSDQSSGCFQQAGPVSRCVGTLRGGVLRVGFHLGSGGIQAHDEARARLLGDGLWIVLGWIGVPAQPRSGRGQASGWHGVSAGWASDAMLMCCRRRTAAEGLLRLTGGAWRGSR